MSDITTKIDLYRAIASKTGYTQRQVETMYEALVDVLAESLNTTDEASAHLPQIGRLKVKVTPAHMGINPRTQEPLLIPAARRAHLKLFPKFSERLNSDNQ